MIFRIFVADVNLGILVRKIGVVGMGRLEFIEHFLTGIFATYWVWEGFRCHRREVKTPPGLSFG